MSKLFSTLQRPWCFVLSWLTKHYDLKTDSETILLLSPQSPNLWSSLQSNFLSALFSKLVNVWYAVLPRPPCSSQKERWKPSIPHCHYCSVGSLSVEFGFLYWRQNRIQQTSHASCVYTLRTKWSFGNYLVHLIYAGDNGLFQHFLLLILLSGPLYRGSFGSCQHCLALFTEDHLDHANIVSMIQMNWRIAESPFCLVIQTSKNSDSL